MKAFASLIVIVACLVGYSCQNLSQMRSGKELKTQVIIKNVSRDDLGRVMIFAMDEKYEKIIFIKDFYSSGNTTENMQKKIHDYIRSLRKLINKTTRVKYFENSIGDKIITGITVIKEQTDNRKL
ncbi:MAG TPA: hypothetical protein PK926_02385 [Spirochaetota bacterium]|nr:hypothetical protein [Spirochaetota bacterium]HPI88358.1 hypothetical protein [Spirochaetota bacterium]HPR46784.1 hypothetical protein [Spirochaetota bacterium]